MLKSYSVYILSCSDNSFYTGITNNLDRRIEEHEIGNDTNSYTYNRRPIKLVFQQEFLEPSQAIKFEKQIKGWSRKKKMALINKEWDCLPKLAKCNNQTSHLKPYSPFDSAQDDPQNLNVHNKFSFNKEK